jgi:hypothetical protein
LSKQLCLSCTNKGIELHALIPGCTGWAHAAEPAAVTAAPPAAVAAAVDAGDTVHFTLGCRNTGNLRMLVDILGVIISNTEPAVGDTVIACDSPPGAQKVAPRNDCTPCSASYTVTQADLDKGLVQGYVKLAVQAPWEFDPAGTDWGAAEDWPTYTVLTTEKAEVPASQTPLVDIAHSPSAIEARE